MEPPPFMIMEGMGTVRGPRQVTADGAVPPFDPAAFRPRPGRSCRPLTRGVPAQARQVVPPHDPGDPAQARQVVPPHDPGDPAQARQVVPPHDPGDPIQPG
jgi:hypothetical protein